MTDEYTAQTALSGSACAFGERSQDSRPLWTIRRVTQVTGNDPQVRQMVVCHKHLQRGIARLYRQDQADA